jgi:hypothetical protein
MTIVFYCIRPYHKMNNWAIIMPYFVSFESAFTCMHMQKARHDQAEECPLRIENGSEKVKKPMLWSVKPDFYPTVDRPVFVCIIGHQWFQFPGSFYLNLLRLQSQRHEPVANGICPP